MWGDSMVGHSAKRESIPLSSAAMARLRKLRKSFDLSIFRMWSEVLRKLQFKALLRL